jgi:hypothetical protein
MQLCYEKKGYSVYAVRIENKNIPQLIRGLRKLNKVELAEKIESHYSVEDVYG